MKKHSLYKKIIAVGAIFLLFGAGFFASIQLGVKNTTSGTWYTWKLPTVQAEWEREDDEYEDDRYDYRYNDDKKEIDDDRVYTQIQATPIVDTTETVSEKLPVTVENTSKSSVGVSSKVTSPKIVPQSIVNSKISHSPTVAKQSTQSTFHTVSMLYSPEGNIFTLKSDQDGVFSYDNSQQTFGNKQALISFLLSQSSSIGQINSNIPTLPTDNTELTDAIQKAENQVSLLTKGSIGKTYIERPFFDTKIFKKVQKPIQTVSTPQPQVSIVQKPSTKKTQNTPAPTTKIPQTPVKDSCPNGDYTGNLYDGTCGIKPKDVCINGDYSGNLYDDKCGAKPKDSCPNGDYTGNLYDGACGTKPKDVCPNGDYTGNLYDGACGTKPKDSCPNGDYTGNLYDGACGTKPKDVCVNGDYSGNLYDGKCGTKPSTRTRAS